MKDIKKANREILGTWNIKAHSHSHPHTPPDRVSEEILPCFILYFSAKTGWTFSICFVTKSIFLLKYSFPLDTSWFNEQKIKFYKRKLSERVILLVREILL